MTEGPVLADRVVEVLHCEDGRWQVGSGFVVRDGVVLTAAHVVGAGTISVRFRGAWERPARLCRLSNGRLAFDEKMDLALIEFDGVSDGAVSFALLRDDPALGTPNLRDCVAFGFPTFAEKDREGREVPLREVVRVDGYVPTGEGAVEGLATLRVPDAPRDLPDGPLTGSPWQGFSGSVVFAAAHVIGVISEHHRPAGMNGLTMVPLSRLDTLEDGACWWEVLGVADAAALPRLPADIRLEARLPSDEVERRLRALILAQPELTVLSSPFGGLPTDFFRQRLLVSERPGNNGQASPVPDVIGSVERLVIIGEAGIGKTTLLHEIARRMAAGDYPGIPVLVRLHDLARRGMDTDLLTFAITEHFGDALGGAEIARLVEFLRERDDVVFLFDALDEVAVGQVDDVLARVRRARSFIMTTRPMARSDVLQNVAATFRITELSDADIAGFVQQWVVREPRAANLPDRIAEDRGMAELARLPQLLVLLCWLWQSTSNAGFETTAQILASGVEEAIARAVRISRLADGEEEVVPWQVRGALRALALEVASEGDGTSIGFTRGRLLALLEESGGRDRAGALLAFTRRTGLVVAAGGSGDELYFLHSLFRTFLAGEALAEMPDPVSDIDRLADRFAGHDILVVAAALDSRRIPGLILDRMSAREPDIFGMNSWLAALCMGGVRDQGAIAHRLVAVADEVFVRACEWWSRDRFAPVLGGLRTYYVRGLLFDGLFDSEMFVRWACALALDHRRESDAVPYLLARLPDETAPPVRSAIIGALGRLRDRSAVPGLWQEFHKRADEDGMTANMTIGESLARLGAARELRMLIERAEQKPATEALIGAMRFVGQPLRGEILDALASRGVTASASDHYRQYIDDLYDDDVTLARKHNALNGLEDVADDAVIDALLWTVAYADDDGLRDHAAGVLLRLPDDGFVRVVDYLVTDFTRPAAEYGEAIAWVFVVLWNSPAVDALADLRFPPPPEPDESDEPLGAYASVVWILIAVLSGGDYGENLAGLIRDTPDPWIRGAAVTVGATAGVTAALDPTVWLLRVEDVPRVRYACLEALRRFAPGDIAELVAPSLDASDPHERRLAVRALGERGALEPSEILARLETESDPAVQLALVEMLQLAPFDESFIYSLIRELDNPDDAVREEAVTAVGAARITECAPRLRAMMADRSEGVADAAAKSFGLVATGEELVEIIDEMIVEDFPPVWMLAIASALIERPELGDLLLDRIEATGGTALIAGDSATVRYPANTYNLIGVDDREPSALLEALADSDPRQRWLAVVASEPHLAFRGMLGAVGLAVLDQHPCVADRAVSVLGSFESNYAITQLDDLSLAVLGAPDAFARLADRLAADDSAARIVSWLLEQREFLPQLMRAYVDGRTELRRVLWYLSDRHGLRLFADGTALLPSGETVSWERFATAQLPA
ncbi:HEAT repeat domain-containing protein [Nocardia asiatica]|uniref:HEAT repeat domain-containing protein n=1 Tax=Nocardia asiatica TaxID=209252 RepID=UPI003EE3EBEC